MVGVNQKRLNIGMIGYKFMGKAHSHAYKDLSFFFGSEVIPVLKVISGRNEQGVQEAANKYGWESYETDWKKVIERDDIDVVDIVTPNHTHAEIAIAAAEAGKHIIVEKPIALTTEEAERMYKAVKRNNVKHMVCFNYRFAPAVQLAKKIIEEGRLGKIYHFRANYLQDFIMDPEFPLVWRLKKEESGLGALGDIGAHIIDLARFLVGEMTEVVSTMETFIKERPVEGESNNSSAMGEVTVDDAVAFIARFENEALGVFEATRFAAGNRNKNKFEINGEKGSIRWDMENMNNLEVYFTDDEPGLQGYRVINCTEEVHPYVSAYWPAGHIIGYEHTFIHLIYEFLYGIKNDTQPAPNFEDGVMNQKLLDAIESSAINKSWIKL